MSPPSRRGSGGLRYAHLVGLLPAHTYACQLVVTGGRGPRRTVRFRTAPAASESFTFAAVGDSGDGSPQAAALVRRILAGRPAFLIHLGDIAYGACTAAELSGRFFRPYRRLLRRVPLFPTPGNHDLHRQSVYRTVFAPVADGEDRGGPHYAFDWASAHFVSVSSPEFGAGDGEGARWLADDLEAARPRPWRIVFLHEPVYSGGTKRVVRGLRADLEPLLEAGGVALLLAGHQHFYERADPACEYVSGASVLEVISGGGGANLDLPVMKAGFPRTVSATHYLRVRVAPTRLDIRAIDLDGHVLDHVHRSVGAVTPCRASGWPRPIEQ